MTDFTVLIGETWDPSFTFTTLVGASIEPLNLTDWDIILTIDDGTTLQAVQSTTVDGLTIDRAGGTVQVLLTHVTTATKSPDTVGWRLRMTDPTGVERDFPVRGNITWEMP